MERRCKASWDHLKVIAKHEMKLALKQKMSDFLKDCAERIIILKIVHRRIINRYGSAEVAFSSFGLSDVSPGVLQVPRLPLVPGPPGLRGARGQRSPLQQNPERICPGVPHHQGARAPAEAEEGQPQRAQQDQRQNDHRCESSSPPADTRTPHNVLFCFAFFFCASPVWVQQCERSLRRGCVFSPAVIIRVHL